MWWNGFKLKKSTAARGGWKKEKVEEERPGAG